MPGFLPRRTLYLALLFLCLAPYRGIFDNWLFNDDFSWLRAARFEMTPGNLLTFKVVEFFRPLVNLSFYLTEKAAPGNVPLEYAFNLALHFLCTLLVFRLILNLLGSVRVAAATAALFAVTSVHAAAVFWISARTTLLSTFFLLASLTVLTSAAGGVILRVTCSIALYLLALASKEEAIAGVFLVGLLFLLMREKKGSALGPAAVSVFIGVSLVYFVARHAFMGGVFRENWGIGAHWIRNVAGAFLFQLYPWPFFSIFYPRGTYLPEPASAFMPEILALPLVVLLVWTGYAAKKRVAMNLAVGWALLAVAPASFFRYRFFSTASISQDRYYYLSSIGVMLCLVLLLSMLWDERSRPRRAAAVVAFVILCAGWVLRDVRLERKWDEFTNMYRQVVMAVASESGTFPGMKTLAVEGSPLAFPYFGDAIALEMPGWRAVEVQGGKAAAQRLAPCVYVSYTGTKPKIMRMEKVEPMKAEAP